MESSEIVKAELGTALEEMGIETTKELDLVIQIKGEVRKLGTQSNIITQLGALEQRELIKRHEARLLPETAGGIVDSEACEEDTPSSSSNDVSVSTSVFQSRGNSASRLEEFKSLSQSLSKSLQEVELKRTEGSVDDVGGGREEEREAENDKVGNTPSLMPQKEEEKEESELVELKEPRGSVATEEDQASSLASDGGDERNRKPKEEAEAILGQSEPIRDEREARTSSVAESKDPDEDEKDPTLQRQSTGNLVLPTDDIGGEQIGANGDRSQYGEKGRMMEEPLNEDESSSEYPESIADEADTARTAIDDASLRSA